MKVGLFGAGTRGDVTPLIALAKRLTERKPDNVITLYISPKHRKLAEKHQMAVSYMENDYLLSRRISQRKRKKKKPKKSKKKKDKDGIEEPPEPRARTPTPPPVEPPTALHDLLKECKQLDLIVYTELLMDEMLTISEYLRIPAVAILFSPNACFPSIMSGLSSLAFAQKYYTKKRRVKINTWREELALKPYRSKLGFIGASWINGPPGVACWSQEVLPRPADWGSNIWQCGYISLGQGRYHYTSLDLKRFLKEADGKIIFITVGTTRLLDSMKFWKTIVETLKELKEKKIYAVLQPMLRHPFMSDTSRAELAKVSNFIDSELMKELGSYVFYLKEEFPHCCIFPQVDAVLHHCGAGTTASVLKSGVVHMPLPIENDHSMWAARLKELGVATKALQEKSLNSKKLTRMIEKTLNNKKMQHKAKVLATKINDSNEGADLCCEYLKDLATRYDFVEPGDAAEAGLFAVLCALPGFTWVLLSIWLLMVVVCVIIQLVSPLPLIPSTYPSTYPSSYPTYVEDNPEIPIPSYYDLKEIWKGDCTEEYFCNTTAGHSGNTTLFWASTSSTLPYLTSEQENHMERAQEYHLAKDRSRHLEKALMFGQAKARVYHHSNARNRQVEIKALKREWELQIEKNVALARTNKRQTLAYLTKQRI